MDATRGTRKSQSRSGCRNGATNAAGRPVHVDRHVDALRGLEGVQRGVHRGDRLVRAVHRRPQDDDDADRVLVAQRHRLGRAELVAARLQRDVPGLDVPVPAELLPADLDVRAHDHVRPVGRHAGRLAPGAPAPQQRHAAEHARLARPGGRAADRLVVRRVPQVAEDVHAAVLKLGGLRVLVLVDHVLLSALGHQRLGLWLHPRGDEGREVQPGVAVEDELITDDLKGRARQDAVLRQLEPGYFAALLPEVHGIYVDLGGSRLVLWNSLVQRHVDSVTLSGITYVDLACGYTAL